MSIRKKKKDEDEDSFASKLSGLGDALSVGGEEEEAESTLESISKIADAAVSIHDSYKKRLEKNRTKAKLPNETDTGNSVGDVFSSEYDKVNNNPAFNSVAEGSDSELFNNEVKGQLDLKDPKNAVAAKAFGANKAILDQNEGTSFTQMMKMDPEEWKKKLRLPQMMPWGGK